MYALVSAEWCGPQMQRGEVYFHLHHFCGWGGERNKTERRFSVRANCVIKAMQLWWSPVTSEPTGDHHLCDRRRSQLCPLGAPDPILWVTDTARSNPEPAYYWWHLRNTEQELQEDPGEWVSCDQLFFKLPKELNGRHEDGWSSLRGGKKNVGGSK